MVTADHLISGDLQAHVYLFDLTKEYRILELKVTVTQIHLSYSKARLLEVAESQSLALL